MSVDVSHSDSLTQSSYVSSIRSVICSFRLSVFCRTSLWMFWTLLIGFEQQRYSLQLSR
uniref:Uncharacterized protein n=1 Tax=Anguilla anguilla TaxID=7936 RepID=A0A0E9SV08_ANGAN